MDLCDEKDERGPCSNYTVKWYYNKDEQKCRRFWYGGCDGNANRFDDEQECQDVCINRVRPNPGESYYRYTWTQPGKVDVIL